VARSDPRLPGSSRLATDARSASSIKQPGLVATACAASTDLPLAAGASVRQELLRRSRPLEDQMARKPAGCVAQFQQVGDRFERAAWRVAGKSPVWETPIPRASDSALNHPHGPRASDPLDDWDEAVG